MTPLAPIQGGVLEASRDTEGKQVLSCEEKVVVEAVIARVFGLLEVGEAQVDVVVWQ